MQVSKRSLMFATAASLLTSTARVLAHGDEKHPANSGPLKREQKDWGIAGDASQAKRRVDVGMADNMRFTPDRIAVNQGETVRFMVGNKGKVPHELVIGTRAEDEKHAALMVRFPDMEHDEPYMTHVPPGKVCQIVWTFNRAGEFEFACLIAGHYQAGMVGQISVSAN
jgi:uncharacterized cupredoxin-like copper-binding protein